MNIYLKNQLIDSNKVMYQLKNKQLIFKIFNKLPN
jgi:hypothetical protein